MRTLIAWIMTLAIGASASAQATKKSTPPPAAKPAQPPAAVVDPNAQKASLDADNKARQEMDRVLDEWEKRSKKVISLDVLFDRIDRAPAWGDQYYQGRAMLQSPDLACLEFTKYKLDAKGKPLFSTGKDGKPVAQVESDPFERIVCTGSKVLQYSWDDKKILIFPLDKQSRQKALQQGPLPFLFNMKAADAKKRYSMTLLKPDDKNNVIGIVPNEDIDKDSFSQAFLWLSKETFLPNRLRLYMVGGKEFQEFIFYGGSNTIRANTPMDKNLFMENLIPRWTVINNPGMGGEVGAAPGSSGTATRRPPSQSATKSTTRPQ